MHHLYNGICLAEKFVIPPQVLASWLMVCSLRIPITVFVGYLSWACTDIQLINKIFLFPG